MSGQQDSEKPRRCGVVVPVPPEIGAQFSAVHERFLRERMHNPVHVTVVYPFLQKGDIESRCSIIGSVCSEFPMFDVSLSEVDTFPEARVVFLKIRDEGNLHRLHLRLIQALGLEEDEESEFRAFERDNYLPHITLGADFSPAEFNAAWSELRERSFTGQFRVTRLCLYQEVGERVWEETACFSLKGATGSRSESG
ncbi:MAG: hypothetical protein GTO55_07365 [Armatimonadetes bacterium]|nr:hypothetical protein [Armatimonadota bacterium]NIM24089.1 hypothetical protein [Armatimonadota bacterium]NIM67943.1 hypothetical protein [Armatimonadota bacterium]NIM76465.1 hypothetical protein [Armatimonadota bacterium]NIN06173.1 hypothetical protein [Armatimonadota bacterium]